MGYETESWRQPTPQPDDTIIFSEHGRSVNNCDFRSHWLMLVKQSYGGYALLVKHGGGEERIHLGYRYTITGLLACDALTDDQRYLVLYLLYETQEQSSRISMAEMREYLLTAFLEGRLKRKKKNNRYSCTVLPRQEAPHGQL